MKRLSCRSCGSNLNTDTFDPKYAVVNCSHCGTTYDASGLKHNPSDEGHDKVDRGSYPRPENIDLKRNADGVTYSWRAHSLIASLVSILFIAFVAGKITETFLPKYIDGFSWHGGNPAEFGIINWVLIVALCWITGVFLLNRHRIRLTGTSLVIDQKPIPVPWKFRKTITRDEIRQLFVAERITHQKDGPSSSHYILRVIDANDALIEVPGNFRNPEEAIYIEHALEQELGLSNISVAGEVGR